MNSLTLQYERLRRHCEDASHTYDHISFIELAHTLRIWVDFIPKIESLAPEFSKVKKFKTLTPSRHTLRTFQGRAYVHNLMAGFVITYASKGNLTGLNKQIDDSTDSETWSQFRTTPPKLELGYYTFVSPKVEMFIEDIIRGQKTERYPFKRWMSSLSVIGAYRNEKGELERFALTRMSLIERVANELDGSHPQGFPVPKGALAASRATHYLLKDHFVAGLPLPYFLLLKDAQDIIEIGKKFFSRDAS